MRGPSIDGVGGNGATSRNGRGPVVLKPVGVSDDGMSLLLARRAGTKTPPFRLRIDEALVEALELAQERARPNVPEPPEAPESDSNGDRPPSKLSPKEIQALLRQGRSVASIARKAAVDEAWVRRFEGPIVWERAGVAARAQRATLSRPRGGESSAPLLEAVKTNLRARGVRELDVVDRGWDAVRHAKKKTWIVTLPFEAKGREHVAQWEFDPASGTLTPLSKLAAELGWVR